MEPVLASLERLRKAIASEVRSAELKVEIESTLQELRSAYRTQREAFTPDVIAYLSSAARLPSALTELEEALEESASVRYRDEAEELITRYQDLAVQLRETAIIPTVETKARRLHEVLHSLPSRSQVESTAVRRQAETRVQQSAPHCPSCTKRMLLRQGDNGGYFWGCSQFPSCYGRKHLTTTQVAQLNNDG
jgi:ribosomal protein L17